MGCSAKLRSKSRCDSATQATKLRTQVFQRVTHYVVILPMREYSVDVEVALRDWSRSLIRPLALAVAKASPGTHGYDLAGRLEELGLGEVPSGTLYPILRRLEDDGLLASEWVPGSGGPGRKVYTITRDGLVELERFRSAWERLVSNVNSLGRRTRE